MCGQGRFGVVSVVRNTEARRKAGQDVSKWTCTSKASPAATVIDCSPSDAGAPKGACL